MRIPHKLPSGQPSGATDGTPGTNPSDKLAIIAQKYAGFFTGKSYRFDQQSIYIVTQNADTKGIHVGKAWKEPVVIGDDCDFCTHTNDVRVVERVAGYQHQIDIEILRAKNAFYNVWLKENGPDVIEHMFIKDSTAESGQVEVGKVDSAVNRRKFIELHQDTPRQTRSGLDRPNGWNQKSLPIVNLPLRLKRKMVIEWNHVYRDYLAANPSITYDFEARIFLKEMPELGPLDCCGGVQVWNQYEKISELHKEDCETAAEKKKALAERAAASGYPIGAWIAAHISENGLGGL